MKIEKIQERASCFMFNDKKRSYSSLLEKCSYNTEVFKSLSNLNPFL